MRHLLTLGIAATALAIPAAVGAHHQPGHQGGGGGGGTSSPTINATSPIVWGRSTVISGTLRGTNNSGQVLDLEADPYPYADSEFAPVASGATDTKGDYRFVAKPELNTRYRVVAKTTPPQTSAVATVLVRIRVKLAVSDSTPRRGRAVRFSGTACPEHDGQLVYIQKRSRRGSFNTVSKTLLKDVVDGQCSSYAKRVRIRADGVYRVVVRSGDADHARGISRRIAINAH